MIQLRHKEAQKAPNRVLVLGLLCFLVALLLLAATYVHFRIAGNADFTGSLAILDRVFDLGFVSALATLTFCIGRRVAKFLQLQFVSVAEELSFSIMLGTGSLGLCVLGFGLVGLLRPLPIGVFVLLLFAALRAEIKHFFELIRDLLLRAFSGEHRKLAFLYSMVLLVLLVRALTPPWAVDEVIYHLPATKLFVDHGRVYPLYHQPLGNMPFLVHMIYALCLLAKADIAAKLFSLLITVLTSLALYAFCVRFVNRTVGIVAMFGFLSASMVVEVGVSTRIDVSLAGMLFLATYAMMIYLDSRNIRWLFASAILSGFSLGIKLNAVLWLACLGLMFLFESRRSSIKNIAKTATLYALITFAISSPWLIKNAIWFHNPIYPFITGELADFTGWTPRYFSAEDEHKLDAHFDTARNAAPAKFQELKHKIDEAAKAGPHRHPLRFWEYYTNPHQYFMGDYHHYPSYLFLFLPFFVIVPRKRWLNWLMLIGVAFFLILASSSWIARFLLPIYPPLTIVAAYTLVELSNRFAGRFGALVCFFVVASCMMFQLHVSTKFIKSLDQLGFISGTTSRSQFLSSLFYHPPVKFINNNLPADAAVLSLGAEMCYHMQRRYISEGSWEGTEWRRLLVRNDSLDEVHNDLKRQGISHILFAPWYFELIAKTGWPKPGGSRFLGTGKHTDPARILEFGPDYTSLRNWTTFDRYRREYLELLYTDANKYEIYRLK